MKPPKSLPALPKREPDHVDEAYGAVVAYLKARIPTSEEYRAAYSAANLLRQWARHGAPPACKCKACVAQRAAAKKGRGK